MALPNLPQNVVDGDEIETGWGNQVAEFVRTVGELVQRGGQLFVTPDGTSIGVLDPATETSILRLRRSGGTASILWEANAGFEPWSLLGGGNIPLTKFERFMDFQSGDVLPAVGTVGQLLWLTVPDRVDPATTITGIGTNTEFAAEGGEWFAAEDRGSSGFRIYSVNPLTGNATILRDLAALSSSVSTRYAFAVTTESYVGMQSPSSRQITTYDRGTGARRTVSNAAQTADGIRSMDGDGSDLWVYTQNRRQLRIYNTDTLVWSNGISIPSVITDAEMRNGVIGLGVTTNSVWIATARGLFRLDKTTGNFIIRVDLPFTPAATAGNTAQHNTYVGAYTDDSGADQVLMFDDNTNMVHLVTAPVGLLAPGTHIYRSTGSQ